MASTSSQTNQSGVSTEFVYKFLGQATNNPTTPSSAAVTPARVQSDSSIAYDVIHRVLDLKDHSVRASHLASNLDMSKRGFNAAKVDGKCVNNDADDGDVLWTADRIMQGIRDRLIALLSDGSFSVATLEHSGLMSAEDKILLEALKREEDSEDEREFVYTSPVPLVTHVVTHNLNTLDLDYSILVEWVEDGSWRNDLVGVSFTDLNTMEVSLSEASRIKITARPRVNNWELQTA